MIVTTSTLFQHAYGKYACGAYNINNAEQIMGLFKGNMDSKAPFIIQLSKGARSYTDKRLLEAMIRAADEIFPDAIFAVHLDHGDEQTAYECIDSGAMNPLMKTSPSRAAWRIVRTPRAFRWKQNWACSAVSKNTSP